MSNYPKWTRVSRREPCGVCRKPDWCTRGEKGWCCMRVESPRMLRNGGWYHPFEAGEQPTTYRPVTITIRHPSTKRAHGHAGIPSSLDIRHSSFPPTPAPPDFGAILQRYRDEERPGLLELEATRLGLSAQALRWLQAAWSHQRQALAIPMYDVLGYDGSRPVGIRYRTRDGRKFAERGSLNGLFVPYGARGHLSWLERLFICEGPTDTAAALDLGYFALGRPACRGGEEFLLRAVEHDLRPAEVIIVTDNDGPGARGARDLLRRLRLPKKLLTPPAKDLRTFRNLGGTKEVLDGMLGDVLRQC